MIPADGAHCCDRSSKVQDLNSTATVETRFMQFRTCESQLELYKRIDNSLVFLAKNWKSLYFRSLKVFDSTPCFQSRFWRCSSDLSETISCQWSLEVYRTATKVYIRVFSNIKSISDDFVLLRCFGSMISKISPKKLDRTFSTPALRGVTALVSASAAETRALSKVNLWKSGLKWIIMISYLQHKI